VARCGRWRRYNIIHQGEAQSPYRVIGHHGHRVRRITTAAVPDTLSVALTLSGAIATVPVMK